MAIREAKAIQQGWELHQFWGKNDKSSVIKAIVQCFFTGAAKIVYNQDDIKAAAAKENIWHQSQTKSSAFRLPSVLNNFRFCAKNEENYQAVMNDTYIPSNDVSPFVKEFIARLLLDQLH